MPEVPTQAQTPAPTGVPQPNLSHHLEEVKRDAEYLYKKRLADQKADAEYEAGKQQAKSK